MFLQKLGLPPNTKEASIRTKLNGKPLEWTTKDEKVSKGGGLYTLGIEVEKMGDGKRFQWNTWTVENGRHVFNFICAIESDGTIVDGLVNCFALGTILIDQDYVDEYLSAYTSSPPVWEKVVLE